EYIYIAKLNKLSMYELGITWSDDRGSTVSPFKSSMRFFKDIAKIRSHKKKYYFEGNEPTITTGQKVMIAGIILLMLAIIALLIIFLVIFAAK
ncbi:MAG: hypothetical protein J5666_07860, partial [Bacilli bacterium]|nr:hypothetical protein [Bacilli bacterium]